MPGETKSVLAWAILLPNGHPLAALVGPTRKAAIAALGEHLWPRAKKNGYRVAKVIITPVEPIQ